MELVLSANCSKAAQLLTANADEPQNNNLLFGANKIANTFLFTGNASLNIDVIYGKIYIEQAYKGAALKTNTTAFRDDEIFSFKYALPLSSGFEVFGKQNWMFSSDSRSIGMNELERLSALLGMKYSLQDLSYIEISAGRENNVQINVESSGMLYNFAASMANQNVLDIDMESRITGEIAELSGGRLNKDIIGAAQARKIYDEFNQINLDFNYKLLNRDYPTSAYDANQGAGVFETRLESSYNAGAKLDFSFSDKITAGLDFSQSGLSVEKSHKNSASIVPSDNVFRLLDEKRMSFSAQAVYNTRSFVQDFSIIFESRDEDNGIKKKFDINQKDLDELKALEKQRDNTSSRTRLNAQSLWNAGRKDTIRANFAISVFQYDTPSDLNNDDRDELNSYATCIYTRRFSDFLKASFTGELQMRHLVFLKSEKSAMNNWNRIIRFGPSFEYNNSYVRFNPSFEVLANYTVYDYEDIAPGIKSYSFRQFKYSDSINVRLEKKFNIQAGISSRYYERGILYWKTFSENPQSGNFELFCNLLIYFSPNENISAGSGVRYYKLAQKTLASVSSYGGDINMKSYGPETNIRISFKSGSYISLNGWYEFQFSYNTGAKKIPNFYLTTAIAL